MNLLVVVVAVVVASSIRFLLLKRVKHVGWRESKRICSSPPGFAYGLNLTRNYCLLVHHNQKSREASQK